jgi:2-keto-4-pentenoate hydratase/2-oxohepta-3-ene-1,7-dioic acid hydratase in catechol pathway
MKGRAVRIARIATDHGPRPVVQHGELWREIVDPFATNLAYTGIDHPCSDVRLLAPVQPTVVIGMAHNGSPAERSRPPQAFLKSVRTLTDPGTPIHLSSQLGQIHIETELAVVMRHTCRNLVAADIPAAVLGYTIGNDITAVDQIPLDEMMTQAKNGDGFTPIGPWIETDLDPTHLAMAVHVNGKQVAAADTGQLARNITEILVYLTHYLTLGPGDIVLTGCPGTFATVKPGDTGAVSVDGIGTLTNPIH